MSLKLLGIEISLMLIILRLASLKITRVGHVSETSNSDADQHQEDGKTQQQIADLVGISIGLVNGIIKSFKTENANNSEAPSPTYP